MAAKVTSMFPVSENVAQMKASSTLAAMQAAEAMRASGVDVVDLGAGEPDFDTPQNIKNAATAAMQAGQTKYTPTAGTRKFQQAIIDFYQREIRTQRGDGDSGRQAGDLQCRYLSNKPRRRSADSQTLLGDLSGNRHLRPRYIRFHRDRTERIRADGGDGARRAHSEDKVGYLELAVESFGSCDS